MRETLLALGTGYCGGWQPVGNSRRWPAFLARSRNLRRSAASDDLRSAISAVCVVATTTESAIWPSSQRTLSSSRARGGVSRTRETAIDIRATKSWCTPSRPRRKRTHSPASQVVNSDNAVSFADRRQIGRALVSIHTVLRWPQGARYVRLAGGQGRGRTADLPLFRCGRWPGRAPPPARGRSPRCACGSGW